MKMRTAASSAVGALNPLQSLLARRWRPQWVCQSCRSSQSSPRTSSYSSRRSLATTATKTDETKPYYATTPIFYVNAAPHVGHMYTMLLTDVLKRWQEVKGRKAILLTGTDEHGMKIQQAAAKAETDPRIFCDKGAEVFKDLAASIDVSNDIFIRTTDKQHNEGVEYAWQILQEKGYLYESKHEGWYSVSDETFYPESQVQLIVDPPTGKKVMQSIETGKEVEWTSERNWHFKLSAFKDRLLKWYEENPDWIVPRARMEDVIRQVSTNLEDLSVSRPSSRLQWGIRVPTDSSQTIYVWLDALMNYATAVGYPFTPGQESSTGFPPDVQVIGKDIVRFHCIYWPAFLMALDLPMPKQILTHAHWTLGRQKMAKSTGNVVNPFFALERFGIDAMRWYLVQEGGISNDADYDNSFIYDKYKKGLHGGLGNLVSRIMRAKNWDVPRAIKRYSHPDLEDGQYPAVSQESGDENRRFYGRLRTLPAQVEAHMVNLHPNLALQTTMNAVYSANGYLQQTSPWTLATKLRSVMADTTGQELHDAAKRGESPEEMEAEIDRIVYLNAETLRIVGIMLQAFIPTSAARMLDMLGVQPERRTWEWCVVGKDDAYGEPMVDLGKGGQGVLFPGLSSDR